MKKNLIILLLSLSALASKAQDSSVSLSLDQAINYALENNFSQQSLSIEKKISENVLEQSKRERLPDLNANLSQNLGHSATTGSSWSGNYGLSSNMTLYAGGKTMNTIRLNKVSLDQMDANIAQAQTTLTMQVTQAFLEVVMNDELHSYLIKVEQTSHEQMLEGEKKLKNNTILESDYLLLKSQAATDRFNVINTRIAKDNSILKLKTLLSMTTQQSLEVNIPPLKDSSIIYDLPSVDEVILATQSWFPDLEIARQDVELSQLNIQQAKASGLPSLALGASLGSGYATGIRSGGYGSQLGDQFNQQIGMTLSIPIWNKGRTKSQVQQASYRLDQSKLAHENAQLQLQQQLEQEYNTTQTGYERFIASAERADAYRQTAIVYQKKFRVGEITVVEMLQQETNYLSALNDYIQNKYTYLLNRKLMDVYMGLEIKL